MFIRWIKSIAKEIFKSLRVLNPNFMKEMFNIKELIYMFQTVQYHSPT